MAQQQQAEIQEARALMCRWMIRRDMADCLAAQAGRPGAWTEEDFLRALRERNCIGMVAEAGDDVYGHMVYELHADRLHLLTLAVAHGSRRAGVGTTLIRKLVSKLSSHRRRLITADVPEGELPMLLFLNAQGFRAVAVLRGAADDGSDCYRMLYEVPGAGPALPSDGYTPTNRLTEYLSENE